MSSTTQVPMYSMDGTRTTDGKMISLPFVFETPYRPDLIHKAFVHLASHSFQPQGRHPTAGMDVVADSNDPPTGRGVSRVARAAGGGGGRQGQGAEVASTRGGRQAHPPTAEKRIYKKLNKKENRLALCSAIAATASNDIVASRGHLINDDVVLPFVISDKVTTCQTAAGAVAILEEMDIYQDVQRLHARKARSGKSSLRGRSKKVGKSVLFIVHDTCDLEHAVGALPGVDVRKVSDLSVLDLAPGSDPARLVVYTESALDQIAKINSVHLSVKRQMISQ